MEHALTRTIVVANQKGGVGKTTSVANLGAALSLLGHQVLLIDLDPQAALTASFGIDPYSISTGTPQLLMRDRFPLSRSLVPVGPGRRIGLMPASLSLAAAEVQIAFLPDRTTRLQQALQRNLVPFDYILIDTPPSLGLLTLNGLVAAREVLIPVQCHYLAMRGVRGLIETIWRVKRKLNPDLSLLGLFATMYDPYSRHSVEVIAELRSVFKTKVFNVIIPENVRFAEVPVAGKTLVEYMPEHEGARAYWQLAEVIASHG
nr:ParA family protein [Anaerolineae bacterium]